MSLTTSLPDIATPALSPEALAAVGAALADPSRVQMLRLLYANDEVACATLETTFALTKSTISYHVRVLRHAGLIQMRKAGKFYYYTLVRDEIERRFPGLLTLLGTTALPEAVSDKAEDASSGCGG